MGTCVLSVSSLFGRLMDPASMGLIPSFSLLFVAVCFHLSRFLFLAPLGCLFCHSQYIYNLCYLLICCRFLHRVRRSAFTTTRRRQGGLGAAGPRSSRCHGYPPSIGRLQVLFLTHLYFLLLFFFLPFARTVCAFDR